MYLIDTTSGCQRIANEKAMILPDECYGDNRAKDRFSFTFDKSKVVVATYARFGVWCSQYPHFPDHFEVIICDEVHNLVQFATFSDESNFTAVARDSICAAVKRGKTLFVGITATPDFLSKLRCPQNYVPLDTSQLVHYKEKRTEYYASVRQLLRTIPPTKHGAIYITSVRQMIQLADIARECGHNPICLWSLSYKKVPMSDEQVRVRAHLLEYEEVPPEYNLLIINASCETAINIRSHMDYFIVHNGDPTHITQARGRYRGDLDTLYLFDRDDGTVIVPDEYLGRELFQKDKSNLNYDLYIRNDKGRYISWEKLSRMITNSGYEVIEGKEDGRSYSIIRQRGNSQK